MLFDGRATILADGPLTAVAAFRATAGERASAYSPHLAHGVVERLCRDGSYAPMVARHEIGHASDHVQYGPGDHCPQPSCLMYAFSSKNLFCTKGRDHSVCENFSDLTRVRQAYRCSSEYVYRALYELGEPKTIQEAVDKAFQRFPPEGK